jgi:hypothetical protein
MEYSKNKFLYRCKKLRLVYVSSHFSEGPFAYAPRFKERSRTNLIDVLLKRLMITIQTFNRGSLCLVKLIST